MKRDGKLSLALHALGHMARAPAPLTSEAIAAHNGTHAVVVRRVLGRLREAGMVASGKGHAGGWRLARAAETISVAEVYRALGERALAAPRLDAPPGCAIEAALHDAVDGALAEAEALLLARLAAVSVADLARAMDGPRSPTPVRSGA
jgi:Rrf2 family protein